MIKQIIACGGGGFTQEPKNPLLDLYILAQAKKKNPKVCLLPTASGDNHSYIKFFEEVFDTFPCSYGHLNVVSPNTADMEDYLNQFDIIYVGGGNTKSMLCLWKEWGVDKILKSLYEKGTILAGVSAGSVCWFDECITDSIPGKFTTMYCLGLLRGSNCVHYGQEERAEAYHKLIESDQLDPGFASEDGVALHFKDGKLAKCVSSRPNHFGYSIGLNTDGELLKTQLETIHLADEEAFIENINFEFLD